MRISRNRFSRRPSRGAVGAALLVALPLLGVCATTVARASEIIPSVGITRAKEGDDKARGFGGLALRGSLLPILKSEVGVSYRSESRFDNQLHVRTWPVTASLWLQPVPMLYGGGGVGWYQTTNDYDQSRVPFKDETKSEFGVHLGGGLRFPIVPSTALDLNGRYVMMEEQSSPLIPNKFNPDFWTASVGLAFGF